MLRALAQGGGAQGGGKPSPYYTRIGWFLFIIAASLPKQSIGGE